MQQKRFLSIHEYLSANLLKTYGIGVPNGEVARSAAEAESIAKKIGMSKLQREVLGDRLRRLQAVMTWL